MTTYEITYTPTGRHNETDKVWISEPDLVEYGVTEGGLIGAAKAFEKIAADNWKTHETMYAITSIRVIES